MRMNQEVLKKAKTGRIFYDPRYGLVEISFYDKDGNKIKVTTGSAKKYEDDFNPGWMGIYGNICDRFPHVEFPYIEVVIDHDGYSERYYPNGDGSWSIKKMY
jgi:hypothetical protein